MHQIIQDLKIHLRCFHFLQYFICIPCLSIIGGCKICDNEVTSKSCFSCLKRNGCYIKCPGKPGDGCKPGMISKIPGTFGSPPPSCTCNRPELCKDWLSIHWLAIYRGLRPLYRNACILRLENWNDLSFIKMWLF